jgi:uncharacterized protein with PQ loop repeat
MASTKPLNAGTVFASVDEGRLIDVIELVGYLASAGAISMWLPQLIRALRNRSDPTYLQAISTSAYSLAAVFNVILLVYGILTHSVPAVAAGGVNLVCASFIVSIKVRA